MGPPLLAMLFVGGMVALILFSKARSGLKKERLLEQAAASLELAAFDPATGVATGKAHGLNVEYRLTTRGSGSDATSWTEVDVHAKIGALELTLRPQTSAETRMVKSGLCVDVIVGDPAFDRAFIVEAAPADVVRALLDEPIRKRLLALAPIEVTTTPNGLRLAKKKWIEAPAAMAELIELVTSMAKRARAARAQADRVALAAQETRGGKAAGYRDAPWAADPEARRGAIEAARRGEIRALENVVAARQRRQRRNAILFFVAVAIIAAASASWRLLLGGE